MSEFRQLGEITTEALAELADGRCLQCDEPAEEFLCPHCREWLTKPPDPTEQREEAAA